MRFTALHHVAIICSEYDRSKEFYTEVLGAKILRETYRAERESYKLDLLLAGQIQLELFSFPQTPARVSRPEACGLRHVALEVDDIEASVAELQRKGLELEPIRVDPSTGKRFTFFADPDGLPWELYESGN